MKSMEPSSLHFDNMDFSDVTFVIEGREIHAHRCILSTRSDYFKAMFHSQMKESDTRIIEIKDVSYHAFHRTLEYMYSNVVTLDLDADAHMIRDLLALTDMYLLANIHKSIKATCTFHCYAIENFLKILPHFIEIEEFREMIIVNLISMWSFIPKRDEVVDLISDHPSFVKEFLKRIHGFGDVNVIKTHLEEIIDKHPLVRDETINFLTRGDWKNLKELERYYDEMGLCKPDMFEKSM